MNTYSLFALIITIAVMIGYLNHRFIKMQTTIAIMTGSLILSFLIIIIAHYSQFNIEYHAAKLLEKLDFHSLLMNGMLSFLLFAGSLTVDITDLKQQKWETGILASLSTILSALLIGFLTYYLLPLLRLHMNLLDCMLFGALISPTDPIAVLAVFKEVGAPRALQATVSAESLLNDGVGIVMFLILYHLAFHPTQNITWQNTLILFFRLAAGGITYGAIIGLIALQLIKPVNDFKIEILVTLSIVTGGYALAQQLGISGPLAMVVAGIMIGNYGRKTSMSTETRKVLDNFWELVDEILNAILFLLIGFELLIVNFQARAIYAAMMAIPLVLLIRTATVALPLTFFEYISNFFIGERYKRKYCPFFKTILIWGGLRGGLAVALALALPASHHRSLILAMTYAVVCFAIIVQGSTIKPLAQMTRKI